MARVSSCSALVIDEAVDHLHAILSDKRLDARNGHWISGFSANLLNYPGQFAKLSNRLLSYICRNC